MEPDTEYIASRLRATGNGPRQEYVNEDQSVTGNLFNNCFLLATFLAFLFQIPSYQTFNFGT